MWLRCCFHSFILFFREIFYYNQPHLSQKLVRELLFYSLTLLLLPEALKSLPPFVPDDQPKAIRVH